ncbi:hypothetical protein KQI38_20740 [Tissierella carlieri]|uniref:hypothetical protein n=1 Tax=Tissierella carlieri TaxID=689904 RepID=UPI001C110457|nr:hypothetical protein [Tissierella carlieri]MBU5314456.1 hypothetical protein [Tissierella carlieri]
MILIENDNNTTIVYTSKEFQPMSETFYDKYAFVGPLVRDLKAFMERGYKVDKAKLMDMLKL